MSLSEIRHVVVLMMENRSLDNMLGYLYADRENTPAHVIPAGSSLLYDGLSYFPPRDPANPLWNPTDPAFFSGGASARIFVTREAEKRPRRPVRCSRSAGRATTCRSWRARSCLT